MGKRGKQPDPRPAGQRTASMGGDGDDELRGNLNGDTIHGDAGSDLIYRQPGGSTAFTGAVSPTTVYGGGTRDDQIWGEGAAGSAGGPNGQRHDLGGGDGFDLNPRRRG